MKKRNKKCFIVLFILSIIAVLMVIYKILVDQMPECRITKLYVDDHSPLIQTYEKKGRRSSPAPDGFLYRRHQRSWSPYAISAI